MNATPRMQHEQILVAGGDDVGFGRQGAGQQETRGQTR